MSKILEELNKENYSNKKSFENNKYEKIISNQNSLSLNVNLSNQFIANNLFITKELTNNNHRINNQLLTNKEKENKYISINDIIGEKCNLNLDLLRLFYNNYEQSKTSKKKMGSVKSYGVNTYQGIVRNYNEDRVSIIINMNKPKNYNKKSWPKISFFGIYDGHGGEGCSEYLRDNLHKLICNDNEYFPDNIPEAIKLGFQKAENDFLNNYALNEKKEIIDRSGSCAVIILLIDKKVYIANAGDSRCLVSMENGKKFIEVTKDHKPNSPNELKRIKRYGGDIYQTETVINNVNNLDINGKILKGPYRVLPGRLSVSRTIGDVEAKLEKYGGNPNVIISEPEIFYYDLTKNDIDFFILGCDGIFDQISSNEVLDCAWMVLNEKDHFLIKQCKDIHNQSGLIVDLIIKSALARKSFDNVTCLFIALKELGMNFNEKTNKNENENNIIKENKSNLISTNISSISPLSISNDMKDRNNFEKIQTRNSDITLNNSKFELNNNDNNNNNYNRNNNLFYLSNYSTNNSNNKNYPNVNTDYKIRNVKLNNQTENISQFNRDYSSIKEKNNTLMNNRLSRILLINNSNDHSRKNQSYGKIANYLNNHANTNTNINYSNYKQIRNNNMNLNTFNNTYSNLNASKRISEGNLLNKKFGIEKINEDPGFINPNNSHIFRPIQKYNINNNQVKINESKNIRKNLSTANNNIINLNIINNNNQTSITSNRYFGNIQNRKNSNYTSIKKNYLNLNQQYKYQSKMINSNNNNINKTFSSISTKNINNVNNIKNQKNNLSLNYGDNNSYFNSNLLRNNDNKVFSYRIERNVRQTSIRKPLPNLPNTSFRLNNKIVDINSNNKINNDRLNIKSNNYKEIDKNFKNYTHNSINYDSKYSNYLITEINSNPKKDYLYRVNKFDNSNKFDNEKNKYNGQLYRRNRETNYRNYRNNNEPLSENEKNEESNRNQSTQFYRHY